MPFEESGLVRKNADREVLWKYPKLKGKLWHRVTVDWSGIKNPGPDKEYKLVDTRVGPDGRDEGEVMLVEEGQPKKWWVPIDNILSNEDF